MLGRRLLALALGLSVALLSAACGSSVRVRAAPTPSAPKGPPPNGFLRVDAAAHAVTITLVASYDGANNGFNFDGYSRELMWTVPLGWQVDVVCKNHGPLRHSCAVVSSPTATTPAFKGARTAQPTIGLSAGQTARFSFRASRPGVYRFACLVPGHEQARMYDVLKISRTGRPSVVDLQAGM